jgi:hypothetical protein
VFRQLGGGEPLSLHRFDREPRQRRDRADCLTELVVHARTIRPAERDSNEPNI